MHLIIFYNDKIFIHVIGAFSAKRLVSAGLLTELGNMRGLDMNRGKSRYPIYFPRHDTNHLSLAEPAIVNGTREVTPGLIMTGERAFLVAPLKDRALTTAYRYGAVRT